MSEAELDIFPVDQRTDRQPGETLALSAMWALDRAPKLLEARLFWYTRGRGIEDLDVVLAEKVPAPAAAGETSFQFKLPNGPYSFSGTLVSLGWAVEFVADQRSARWDFTLTPTGKAIVLKPVPGK
jgi:hypothetical protein